MRGGGFRVLEAHAAEVEIAAAIYAMVAVPADGGHAAIVAREAAMAGGIWSHRLHGRCKYAVAATASPTFPPTRVFIEPKHLLVAPISHTTHVVAMQEHV